MDMQTSPLGYTVGIVSLSRRYLMLLAPLAKSCEKHALSSQTYHLGATSQ